MSKPIPEEDDQGNPIALIKFFSQEEHYLAFKNGSSLFRPPHYYRNLDNPGRGDRTESCLGYWNTLRGDQMPNLELLDKNNEPLNLELSEAEKLLIHPGNEPKDKWFQCWSFIKTHNGFEDSMERMIEEFGSYFVILPAQHIHRYAEMISHANDSSAGYCQVKYSDDPLKRNLLTKDISFSYQKEFRFFVGECSKEETADKFLNLPDLDSLLLNEAATLKMTSPEGKVRYFSQGKDRVITVEADQPESESAE